MVSWDMVRHHALVCKAGGLHIWDLVEEPTILGNRHPELPEQML